jgi:hypothetical protein
MSSATVIWTRLKRRPEARWAQQRLEGQALHTALDLGKRLREYQTSVYIKEAEEKVGYHWWTQLKEESLEL